MPPEINPETTPNTTTPKVTPPELRQIRTYQGDIANALSRQNESLVSIQQSEILKRRATGMPHPEDVGESEKKKRGDFLFLFIGTIFFITVGAFGAWYGYRTILERTAPPVISIPESRLISPNIEIVLNTEGLDRLGFSTAFDTQFTDVSEGELKHVVIKNGALPESPLTTTAELMTLVESRAPGSLVRSFDRVFMTGALGGSRFIIIKLASFENAFAGMLSWEENMAEDLIPIFTNANEVKAIAPTSVFKDVIVRNKDVRVLETTSSTTEGLVTKPILLYSFFDNNLLIITDSIETLQSLIEKLVRERLSR